MRAALACHTSEQSLACIAPITTVMLPFIMAALLTVPAPSPPPSPPCVAHRLFCGAIRIVPRDPSERTVFVSNAIATLADGIVTAIHTHGDPQLEQNLALRPFIRGGLPGLLLGWSVMQIGQHAIDRRFHLSDERMQGFALQQHISGIASWLSPRTFAWTPNEWEAYHQPIAEAAWIRYDATAGKL